MNDDLAFDQLKALAAVPGALKVITSEVQPALREDKKDARSAAKPDVDLRQVSTFVLHDVTHLDGPNERGLVTAHTAEGDYLQGHPAAVLARLTEHQRAP